MSNNQAALIAAASQLSIAYYYEGTDPFDSFDSQRSISATLQLADRYKEWLDQRDEEDLPNQIAREQKRIDKIVQTSTHRPRFDEETRS